MSLRVGVLPAMINATSRFNAIQRNTLSKCRTQASSVLNYAMATLFQGVHADYPPTNSNDLITNGNVLSMLHTHDTVDTFYE